MKAYIKAEHLDGMLEYVNDLISSGIKKEDYEIPEGWVVVK